MTRPKPLQDFFDAILVATDRHVNDPRSIASLSRIRAALQTPSNVSPGTGARLPVCTKLSEVLKPTPLHTPELLSLVKAFLALQPDLDWRRREGDMLNASANINEGHANVMIAGPMGYERRSDVLIGASLIAPHVRYPDHTHPPEETYLVLSEGSFRHGRDPWFEPGIGGTFYNSPGILHAMRSGATPLFAFWLLWNGPPAG